MTAERVGTKNVRVVIPVHNEKAALPSLLDNVFDQIDGRHESRVILAAANYKDDFLDFLREMQAQDDRIDVIAQGDLQPPLTFAASYLRGLQRAALDPIVDYVIEMDASGSHDPRYLEQFVDTLDRADAALSSRFSQGGAIMNYSLQRQFVSRFGTMLANMSLGLSREMPDWTSGYQGFRSEALRKVFDTVPFESWISLQEVGHFYQTEIRTYLDWLRYSIEFVPIVFGQGRVEKSYNLPSGVLFRSFRSLLELRARRKGIVNGGGLTTK